MILKYMTIKQGPKMYSLDIELNRIDLKPELHKYWALKAIMDQPISIKGALEYGLKLSVNALQNRTELFIIIKDVVISGYGTSLYLLTHYLQQENTNNIIAKLHGLRQEHQKIDNQKYYYCLSVFILNKNNWKKFRWLYYIGLFAVSSGFGKKIIWKI